MKVKNMKSRAIDKANLAMALKDENNLATSLKEEKSSQKKQS